MRAERRHTDRKRTRRQSAVVDALASQERFLSAQELHATMRSDGAQIGLATVYRALQSMVDAGELDVVRSGEGEHLYRLCQQADHHHHLVCRGCARTEDVHPEGFEAWAAAEARRLGFSDVQHTVELFGVCADCAQERGTG